MANTYLFSNNASSTLAGSITNTDTSCNLAAGTGVLFPDPGAGEQFALSFTDVATGLLHEIVYCTARSVDTCTIVRGQEGTVALNWAAGDLAQNLLTAGTMRALGQNQRIRLQADTDFFVATTGDDDNNGLSNLTPWLTLQHAWDVISNDYDLNNFDVTINVADGTYTAGVLAQGGAVGTGNITFSGNTGAPQNCIVSVTLGVAFEANVGAPSYHVEGFKMVCTGTGLGQGNGIEIDAPGALITVQNCQFACDAYGVVVGQGFARVSGPIEFVSGGQGALYTQHLGEIIIADVITMTGTPNFSQATLQSSTLSEMVFGGGSFSGSATGKRFNVDLNSVIETGSGTPNTFIPGNVSGTTANGGVCL